MVISVLAAIGVAGRAAFFMVPSFKPVAAIVILTGISFGGRGGFFSWQPYHADLQHVYGAGPLDTLADVCLWHDRISGRDPVPEGDFKSQEVRSLYLRIFKCLFNLWRHYESCQHPDVLRIYYKKQPDRYYISGAPVDLVHAASTVIFLWLLSRPLLEKLERIKVKYELMQESENR